MVAGPLGWVCCLWPSRLEVSGGSREYLIRKNRVTGHSVTRFLEALVSSEQRARQRHSERWLMGSCELI